MKSIYDNAFEHHGIKGQKWGVQNGPPYPLDENRGSSGKHRLFGNKAKTVEEKMKSHSVGEEDLKKMTNQELDDYIDRLFKEKKLVSLQDETKEALKNSAAKNASKIGKLALKAGGAVLKLAWNGTVWTVETLGKNAIEGIGTAIKESIVESAKERRDENKPDKNKNNKQNNKQGNNLSKKDRADLIDSLKKVYPRFNDKQINNTLNHYLKRANNDPKRVIKLLIDDLNKAKQP